MASVSGFSDFLPEWPYLQVTVGTLAVCVSYYVLNIARKPRLIAKQGSFLRSFLVKHCPIMTEPYWPTIWCYGGRGQTIIGSILRSHPVVHYRHEFLTTLDGGEICLHWQDNGSESTDDPDRFPTVLILPGLTGCSQQGYVLHFVKQIQSLGYRSVVFNNRGLGGAKLKTPRTFCAANTEDLEFVIGHLHKTKPGIPLIAVGVSLGGMILTNYLANMGQTKPTGLIAAMTVSVPWDVFKSTKSLEEPLNWVIFNRHLTNLLCKLVMQHLAMARKGGKNRPIDIDHVLKSKSIREFDDRYIAPMFGFSDSDDYYTAASLHSKPLEEISIPLLSLCAADDPFAPISSLPLDKIKQCPNVVIALTSFGGHIGFTEGLLPTGAGYADRMMCQFVKSIFENRQALQDQNCLSDDF